LSVHKTVNWGLVYMEGQPPADADVAAALKEAGLDARHNAETSRRAFGLTMNLG
jgi:hypothetical protein